MDDPTRPPFTKTMREAEFQRWYWPKAALEDICRQLGISRTGSKAQLRKRVADYLARRIAKADEHAVVRASVMDWSKTELTLDTLTAPDITFGRNVRGFFKEHIGKRFVCNADFMAWVKANEGKTLRDAIDAWQMLEKRKANPAFRRAIASHNNYLQYLRDFADAFPARPILDAKRCWDSKKIRPAKDGYVVFEESDLRFLE